MNNRVVGGRERWFPHAVRYPCLHINAKGFPKRAGGKSGGGRMPNHIYFYFYRGREREEYEWMD